MKAGGGPGRWPEVERILDLALELAPEDRSALLDRSCAGDPDLRAEVEAMLAGADSDEFLKSPAAVLAAPMLEAETTLDGITALTWRAHRPLPFGPRAGARRHGRRLPRRARGRPL